MVTMVVMMMVMVMIVIVMAIGRSAVGMKAPRVRYAMRRVWWVARTLVGRAPASDDLDEGINALVNEHLARRLLRQLVAPMSRREWRDGSGRWC